MKVAVGRFSPRKEVSFFSQARKTDLPGLKVFLKHITYDELRYAISVQAGGAVERNMIKREIKTWLYNHKEQLKNKKIFIIVLQWNKAKQELDKINNLV